MHFHFFLFSAVITSSNGQFIEWMLHWITLRRMALHRMTLCQMDTSVNEIYEHLVLEMSIWWKFNRNLKKDPIRWSAIRQSAHSTKCHLMSVHSVKWNTALYGIFSNTGFLFFNFHLHIILWFKMVSIFYSIPMFRALICLCTKF